MLPIKETCQAHNTGRDDVRGGTDIYQKTLIEIEATKMARRRRRSGSDDDDDEQLHRRTEKRSRPRRRRGHLHILTKEYTHGFNIYKLDVDDFDSEDLMDSRPRRLRRHRLVVRLAGGWSQTFVAMGAKIFSLHRSSEEDKLSVIYDAKTRSVSTVPPFQAPKNRAAFWAAGDTIYALDCCGSEESEPGCFERLAGAPPPAGDGEWRWEALPSPPFELGNVVSHAVHPDAGATVFLSVYNAGTFSFDGESMAWTRHGGWLLPFDGEAYYVRELRAWVGISLENKGRIASCPVVEARGGAAEPAFKSSAKDLLRAPSGGRHVKANLTYMGDAEFCFQQTFTREVVDGVGDHDDSASILVGPTLLRIVTFRVAYSGDGELCTVGRKARIYKLDQHLSERNKPFAYWI